MENGIEFLSGLKLLANKYLDVRQSFNTLTEMKNINDSYIPDGLMAYCAENKIWYVYDKASEPTSTTGKWRASSGASWNPELDFNSSTGILKIKRNGTDVSSVDIGAGSAFKDGDIVTDPEGQPKGTYLMLILEKLDGTEKKVYINLSVLGQNMSGMEITGTHEMPKAVVSLNGKIKQYLGKSNDNYQRGLFYVCEEVDGAYKWVPIEVSSSDLNKSGDYKDTIKNNVYNSSNLTINKLVAKIDKEDIGHFKVDAELNTYVTDIKSQKIKLMELPKLRDDYEFDEKIELKFTEPSGVHTSIAVRDTYWGDYRGGASSTGEWLVNTCILVADGETYDDSGNRIFLGEQNHTREGVRIFTAESLPVMCHNLTEEISDTLVASGKKLYVLKQFDASPKYHSYYYDKNKKKITGDFYELEQINPTLDGAYIQMCYIYERMLRNEGMAYVVDMDGKICSVTIQESEQSKLVKANAKTNYNGYHKHGYNGTIVFTPIEHKETQKLVTANFDKTTRVLSINGAFTIKSFKFVEVM